MTGPNERRVLVVAPRGRDAALICDMLRRSDIDAEACPSVESACAAAKEGAGAMLMAEEALVNGALARLSEIIHSQPRWSDLPMVLLTSNGERIRGAGRMILEQSGARGNLLIVERPARALTLRSAVLAALSARERQYELRDFLEERTRNEERLRQTQKLESIGILAGGVAHDFNNLLTGVLGNASLALELIPPGSRLQPLLEDVMDATERAVHLTNQLLAYAGKGKFTIEAIDLTQQAREIAALMQTSIPKTVRLKLDLGEGLPPVKGDPAQIQQIIMNLVINAAEAVPEGRGGTVQVITRVEEVDERFLRGALRDETARPGCYVALEVRDDGCGMDEATMSRIFDPFFTTKFMGRGLGLAAVSGIVRGHKGALKIASVPGEGSVFTALFPAAVEAPAGESPRRELDSAALAGAGLILVVDDEEIVRRAASSGLRRFGYRVLVAEDGRSGVEVYRAKANEIDLVLLDMTMPVMGGEETYREIRGIRPDARVILSSGYNEKEAIRRFSAGALAGFLQKPYTAAELAAKVKAALKR
jgi:signal transduction histidine kinase/ActR/RegA family two-component response regulator